LTILIPVGASRLGAEHSRTLAITLVAMAVLGGGLVFLLRRPSTETSEPVRRVTPRPPRPRHRVESTIEVDTAIFSPTTRARRARVARTTPTLSRSEPERGR
jgi:hypothetical protein